MRQSLLRRAMENSDVSPNPDEQAAIIMNGPLADVYSKALQVVYDNENPLIKADEDTAPLVATLESQQIDATIMQSLAKLLNPTDATPTDNYQTVFGVSKDDVNQETLVDVSQALVQQAVDNGGADNNHFILIVDDTGSREESTSELQSALEAMVERCNGKVYHSLSEYVKSL